MAVRYKGPGFKAGVKKLLADLKPMTWKQRLDHIWTYYKEYMWLAGVGLLVVCAIISSAINANKDVLVSGIMVNISIEQEGYDYLQSDYLRDLGGKGNQVVELEYTNFSSLEDPTSTEDNYAAFMLVIGRVSGGYLDYMILDQFGMEYYIPQDVYLDLREFFTEEELKEMGSKVIYAREEGQTESYPVAIDITDVPFIAENVGTEEKTYFALSGSTKRPEMCRDVWNRIHAWKAEE